MRSSRRRRFDPLLTGFRLRHHLQQRARLDRELSYKRSVIGQDQQQRRGHANPNETGCNRRRESSSLWTIAIASSAQNACKPRQNHLTKLTCD